MILQTSLLSLLLLRWVLWRDWFISDVLLFTSFFRWCGFFMHQVLQWLNWISLDLGFILLSVLFLSSFLVLSFLSNVWWLEWGLASTSVADHTCGGGQSKDDDCETGNNHCWEWFGFCGSNLSFFFLELSKSIQSKRWWANAASSVGVWSESISTVGTCSEPSDDLAGIALIWKADAVRSLSSGVWHAFDALGSILVVDFSFSGTASNISWSSGVCLNTSGSACVWNVTVTALEAWSISLSDIKRTIAVSEALESVRWGSSSEWAWDTLSLVVVIYLSFVTSVSINDNQWSWLNNALCFSWVWSGTWWAEFTCWALQVWSVNLIGITFHWYTLLVVSWWSSSLWAKLASITVWCKSLSASAVSFDNSWYHAHSVVWWWSSLWWAVLACIASTGSSEDLIWVGTFSSNAWLVIIGGNHVVWTLFTINSISCTFLGTTAHFLLLYAVSLHCISKITCWAWWAGIALTSCSNYWVLVWANLWCACGSVRRCNVSWWAVITCESISWTFLGATTSISSSACSSVLIWECASSAWNALIAVSNITKDLVSVLACWCTDTCGSILSRNLVSSTLLTSPLISVESFSAWASWWYSITSGSILSH